eukprot:9264758-Lingulodinium_polyedra.AAC.1
MLVRDRAMDRTLAVQWIPARRTAEDYAARGLPERHRCGNATADAAASGAALARAAPRVWREYRAAQLAD